MGCFSKPRREPVIQTTRQASDLDALPGANARRKKRKKGQLYAGEAQRDLGGLSLSEGGLLGAGERDRKSMFG